MKRVLRKFVLATRILLQGEDKGDAQGKSSAVTIYLCYHKCTRYRVYDEEEKYDFVHVPKINNVDYHSVLLYSLFSIRR